MIRRLALFKFRFGVRRGDPCVARWMDMMRELPKQKQIRTGVDRVFCDNEYQDRKKTP